MLDPALENMIIYIPVDDETEGGTPILRSIGLKIAPPPSPKAPDTHPPMNPNITSLTKVLP